VHPRVSVSAICTRNWTLDEDLAFYADAGITNVGLSWAKLDAHGFTDAIARVRTAGLRVTNVLALAGHVLDDPTSWPAARERIDGAIEAAVATGAGCVVVTSGRPGTLAWDAAADAWAEVMEPCASRARAAGVILTLEHTNSLRVDLSFVHTLRDALDLASRLDMGVCMECNTCWMERGVEHTIAENIDRLALVQVSDFVVGTFATPDRVVPGDGDIPLERLLRAVVDAGYVGAFDLEVIGPRIEAEGYAAAIPRGVRATERLLEAVGVSA
jgi:sugar phosphate isomerase/epimerase